jgi:protein involved in polysaccharide export with SLBB domain/capsular polysaccharide biosynthesis protein
MSEDLDLNISELRRQHGRREGHADNGNENWEHSGQRGPHRAGDGFRSASMGGAAAGGASASPFNFWGVFEMLLRRWTWLLAGAAISGAAAFLIGVLTTGYTAQVMLIRRENPNAFTAGAEGAAPHAFLSRELSAMTLFGLMRSPDVLRRVSAAAQPPITPDKLAGAVKVVPDRNPDFVSLAVSGKESKETLAGWANLYAEEVVKYTRELQSGEAGIISDFLKLKLISVEADLAHVNNRMLAFAEEAQVLDVDREVEAFTQQLVLVDTRRDTTRIDFETIDLRIQHLERALEQQTPANDTLQSARERLALLRAQGLTDLHPEVERQIALVKSLESQAETAAATTALQGSRMAAGSLANAIQMQLIDLRSQKEVLKRQMAEYENLKLKIQDRAKGLSRTAIEYAQMKAGQKRMEDLRITLANKQQEAQLLSDNALGYYRIFSPAEPESVNARKRYFVIAVLSMVGALLGMLAGAGLAFIAEAVDNRLKSVSDVERATGLPVLATLGDLEKMSAEEQIAWAFRTLTILQGKLNTSSDQTLVCGFISSRHGEGRSTWIDLLVGAAGQRGMRVLTVATRQSTPEDEPYRPAREHALLPAGDSTTLTKSVLTHPAQVTEQFNNPQAQPIVHIPLPGWVWSLERRKQWRTAIDHWQEIENMVLLIELPPASQPESVLLAEHLPQVIWLASSGMPTLEETRAQVEMLRHARCNLVGSVLNREPSSFVRRHLSKLFQRFSLFLAFAAGSLNAAEPIESALESQPPNTRQSFSVNTPVKRAAWQDRLTLGPGDLLDISLFGRPELTRTNVVVGPDGRISYLQIQDFAASGLTVDELRSQFDTELRKYYLGARTIIIPVSFNSKKYFILGRVANEGVFVLDRPLTIIEAVARAGGLRTGMFERNLAEMADLGRSFLVRHGQRVPIDLGRLFYAGDLAQNLALEPNDYLYFAPIMLEEIYVLGEVLAPGIVGAGPGMSLIKAISSRGGFTPRAYQKRILVVRGSLQQPETFAVDAPPILAGRTPDFRLKPRDIVFVNERPWIKVEELLDIAIQSFIEAAVTTWAGSNIDPIITSPILPRL